MNADLLPALDAFSGVPVLLLGDLMLDRYIWGDVSRISPEAPVPVLQVTREEARLGGAGSVIANLAALGAEVHALGVLGADLPGDRMLELLTALSESAPGQVDTGGILRDATVHTTQKTRLISRTQHLLRIDRDAHHLPGAALDRLAALALERLDAVRVVLVSDYGRGVLQGELCRTVATEARRRGIPVLVDPHRAVSFARYAGATALTPNRAETANAVGIEPRGPASIRQAAWALIERFELDYALVTLDRDGMFLLRREDGADGAGETFPAKARQVFDVAGAGDMVLSVFGLAVGAGVAVSDAIRIANVAAGWEVEQLGVVPIRHEQLAAELRYATPPELRQKIVSRDEAARRGAQARDDGKEVVFTNGCFDLLHAGHVHFLQGCRAKGSFLVVGLNTDESIRGLKGPERPVLPLAERAALLAGLESVNLVVPFPEPTPIALIEALRPDILCKGDDYRGKEVVGREVVEAYGGRVELVELLPGVSTTHIIARING